MRLGGIAAVVLVGCGLGCGDHPTPAAAPMPTTDVAPKAPPKSDFHYQRAFTEATVAGVLATPLLEVANGRRGKAWILAAVHRPGQNPPVRVEMWKFDQQNAKQLLRRSREPTVFMRLHAADAAPPDAEEIGRLRQQIATPGTSTNRSRGLAVDTPQAGLAKLVQASKMIRDEAASPADQVAAIAELFAGLDERLLLEKQRLNPLLTAFSGTPQPVHEQANKGTRRVVMQTGPADQRHRLEWTRTRTGWILTGFDPVADEQP